MQYIFLYDVRMFVSYGSKYYPILPFEVRNVNIIKIIAHLGSHCLNLLICLVKYILLCYYFEQY